MPDAFVARTLDEAMSLIERMGDKVESTFVIGGSSIYKVVMYLIQLH